jgi:hypothetical protein
VRVLFSPSAACPLAGLFSFVCSRGVTLRRLRLLDVAVADDGDTPDRVQVAGLQPFFRGPRTTCCSRSFFVVQCTVGAVSESAGLSTCTQCARGYFQASHLPYCSFGLASIRLLFAPFGDSAQFVCKLN